MALCWADIMNVRNGKLSHTRRVKTAISVVCLFSTWLRCPFDAYQSLSCIKGGEADVVCVGRMTYSTAEDSALHELIFL